ncbi:AAA family ATPase [Acetobacterium fimetarium]|uniref:AAA family ATPase n=1 Tax=Acetobacterium fimetarium TaxID=52691 RepID=A0ABR6WST9_9FIRM|nr:ATP-binding protein [Acetobacterium fimetarium]MBC3803667.1 AAA family ATPase [Acetobacterium fimetarium]
MNASLKSIVSLSQQPPDADPRDYLKDGLLYCHRCHTPKQVVVQFGPNERTENCNCECKQQDWEDQKKQRELKERQHYHENMRTRGIQDAALRECSFEQSDGSNPENMAIAQTYAETFSEKFYPQGSGLLLWGDVGTGKSFVAACIANTLIDAGIPALMTSFTRIFNELFSERDKNKYIDAINYNQLLIIDDLGVGQQNDFALENLFTIIDERYKSNKPLIITTNLTLEQMETPAQMAHKRIYDRILEKCTPLAFDGSNKRQEKRMINFAAARQQFAVAKRR